MKRLLDRASGCQFRVWNHLLTTWLTIEVLDSKKTPSLSRISRWRHDMITIRFSWIWEYSCKRSNDLTWAHEVNSSEVMRFNSPAIRSRQNLSAHVTPPITLMQPQNENSFELRDQERLIYGRQTSSPPHDHPSPSSENLWNVGRIAASSRNHQ